MEAKFYVILPSTIVAIRSFLFLFEFNLIAFRIRGVFVCIGFIRFGHKHMHIQSDSKEYQSTKRPSNFLPFVFQSRVARGTQIQNFINRSVLVEIN